MTESTKVVQLRAGAEVKDVVVDRTEIENMKAIFASLHEASAHAPSTKVNDVVNDLVEFMLVLTQKDCEIFARSIRQVMDGVVDARSTHKDEYVSTFHHKDSDTLTDHQKLIRSLQRDRDAVEGRMGNDISNAIKNAGFEPRGVIPSYEPTPTLEVVNVNMSESPSSDFESRLSILENTVLEELEDIKRLLASKA